MNFFFKNSFIFLFILFFASNGNSTQETRTLTDNIMITIERTHGSIQGQQQSIEINMHNLGSGNLQIGGYDFLVGFDASKLTFQSADAGQFLLDCGWEYFTYRYSPHLNNNPLDGGIRITAIAETNLNPNHPSCYSDSSIVSNQLAVINFLVTNDRTFECAFAPIQFFWYDCNDNTIINVSGNLMYLNNNIYNYNDTSTIDYTINLADDVPFPTYFGANSTCNSANQQDTLRIVDFVNGGVEIACADSIDARGDLNLNEIAYEIADAVLYSNYFVHGLSVFTVNVDGQIAASDVNADGLSLSLSDLVYLIRVNIGDANPYPENTINEVTSINTKYQHADNGIISVSDEIQIAAAHIVVEGNISPTLLADNMTMINNFDGINTRILIYSLENNNFTGEMINIGNNELVSFDMADNKGIQVVAKWTPAIPMDYDLAQNYPNPFNPTTKIEFSLPVNANVTLTIYNINGQTVKKLSGIFKAGIREFKWDASTSASGVYFYSIAVNGFKESKKMVILK